MVGGRDLRSGKLTAVGVREQKCHREGSCRVRLRGQSWDLLRPSEVMGLASWRREFDKWHGVGVHCDTVSRHYPLHS